MHALHEALMKQKELINHSDQKRICHLRACEGMSSHPAPEANAGPPQVEALASHAQESVDTSQELQLRFADVASPLALARRHSRMPAENTRVIASRGSLPISSYSASADPPAQKPTYHVD
mgnify:CR=1 FL=1